MIKKIIVNISLTVVLVLNICQPMIAYAAPTPPTAPTAPAAPTPPTAPTAPTAPKAPTPPPSPWDPTPTPAPVTPTPTKAPKPTATPTPVVQADQTGQSSENAGSGQANVTPANEPNPTDTPTENTTADTAAPDPNAIMQQSGLDEDSGRNSNVGNTDGSVSIESAPVTGTVNVSNDANQSVVGLNGGGSGTEYAVNNDSNGQGTSNNGTIGNTSDTQVFQDNDLVLGNNVDVDLDSGRNKISDNLGGDSSIKSGDVTSTVNVINFANTNLTGVGVGSNEFNVVDNQTGDIDLSRLTNQTSTCGIGVSLCGEGNVAIGNTKNGNGSENEGVVQTGNNLIIVSDNYADVQNDIDVEVDTGKNRITDSVGDASIETGDANAVVNVLNFINSNLVGITDLVVNTINVLSEFAGNIILPKSVNTADTLLAVNNSGNGANSNNSGTVDLTDTTYINQNNEAVIANNVRIDAETGNNNLKDNINGEGDSNLIKTGDINTTASVNTVANQNYYGDDLNIIFLNREGHITSYYLDASGQLTPIEYAIDNSGNGTNSTNNGEINQNNNTEIYQNNVAFINNNINIDANTGGNTIRDNIDGSTEIKTGDVNVFSSVTNFINTNFIGGRVIFTFVNDLFGLWSGFFASEATAAEIEENASENEQPVEVATTKSNPANIGGPMDDVVNTNEQPGESLSEEQNSDESSNTLDGEEQTGDGAAVESATTTANTTTTIEINQESGGGSAQTKVGQVLSSYSKTELNQMIGEFEDVLTLQEKELRNNQAQEASLADIEIEEPKVLGIVTLAKFALLFSLVLAAGYKLKEFFVG